MKYAIIGLGNYGNALAENLIGLGHEIIGVDMDMSKVDALKDKITATYRLDATDLQSLLSLPLKGVDVVIVAIGENLGASIRVVALLKKMKIEQLYARAIDDVHEAILEAFDITRILKPEVDSAKALVRSMDLHANIEAFNIDNDYHLFIFDTPSPLVGINVNTLELENRFSLKILSVKRGKEMKNFLGISIVERQVANTLDDDGLVLTESDQLVCYGRYHDFQRFWKAI